MIETKEQLEEWQRTIAAVREQIGQVIVGQEEVIEQMLWAIFAQGHALLEGIPGLGKTLLVRTTSEALDLQFSRIQFTPDLMPADITGTNIIQFGTAGESAYQFQHGPIFGNLVLADEINRATPKTQSALLEAMQEKTVTIGSETYQLPRPFFVLATQNPIENEGTYPLPEAQLDRFLLKIHVTYPSQEELKEIVQRTTSSHQVKVEKVASGEQVAAIQQGAKEVLLADEVLDDAVQLLMMTHPTEKNTSQTVRQYVQFGAGPRGVQAMVALAKVRAICAGRTHVSRHDIEQVALPALRHRLLLNFEGQATGISTDEIINELLEMMGSR